MNEELKNWLDSEEFYDAMQGYRTASITDQKSVIAHFEAVKQLILDNLTITDHEASKVVDMEPVAFQRKWSENYDVDRRDNVKECWAKWGWDAAFCHLSEQLASLQGTIKARNEALDMLRKDFGEQLASVQRDKDELLEALKDLAKHVEPSSGWNINVFRACNTAKELIAKMEKP